MDVALRVARQSIRHESNLIYDGINMDASTKAEGRRPKNEKPKSAGWFCFEIPLHSATGGVDVILLNQTNQINETDQINQD
jgi:hypothetical protein